MNPSDNPSAPPGSPRPEEDRLRARRRTAILGGLGKGSAVLGALASKPVLGAVPYHCTVSGQVSGNLSRSGAASACVIGSTSAAWITADWPSPLIKGTAPDKNCGFASAGLLKGTPFNGYKSVSTGPALEAAFFNKAAGTSTGQYCDVLTTATTNAATMLQVLTTTSSDDKFVLGRVVVTSLLNAVQYSPNYPVSTNTIIWMFNATFNGGQYEATPGNFWTREVVIWYLKSLYTPVT